MGLIIVANTDKIRVDVGALFPDTVKEPIYIWYKDMVVNFVKTPMYEEDGKTLVTPHEFYINVNMISTQSWQLDNDGSNGLSVDSIKGVDTTAFTNDQLLSELYTL